MAEKFKYVWKTFLFQFYIVTMCTKIYFETLSEGYIEVLFICGI